MKIGFYLSEGKTSTAYVLADEMIRSVRKSMPGVHVCQFTDERSSVLYGVDSFVRKDGKNTMRLRLQHYATPGEWLFVDTDLLVQADVSHVFDNPFDIAVSDREGSMLPGEIGGEFMRRMPYNLGAVFSRSPEFWQKALAKFDSYSEDVKREIVADQLAVNETIKESAFNVKILPGARYNLSPREEAQDVSDSAIVHYKGNRKYWMLRQLYNELGLAA